MDGCVAIGGCFSGGSVGDAQGLIEMVGGPLTSATPSLDHGRVRNSYRATLRAVGGAPPYTWSVVGGRLPPGLRLHSHGVLSGTPKRAGRFSFVAEAKHSATPEQATVRQRPTLPVKPAFGATKTTLRVNVRHATVGQRVVYEVKVHPVPTVRSVHI